MADLDPSAVLRRIAFLLERQRADTYRVRAFRRVAEAVAEQEPERLRVLHEAGRLKDLAGVGETTAAIIGEVLDGRVPAYLKELEAAPCQRVARPLTRTAVRCKATATATATDPTVAATSARWPKRPSASGTATWP